MKAWENKLVTILFAFAGVLFLLVAVVKPVIKGQPLNVLYLGLGVVCLIVGVVVGRRSGDGSGPPSA
jgi:hypothetical protein